MDNAISAALHFETMVWPWPIAIYLFLAGVSAGSILIGIATKMYREYKGLPAHQSGIVKGMALIAPIAVIIGLGILIIDLTKPLEFWKMMIYWNPTSVMFWGVMLLSVYIMLMFIFLVAVFHEPLKPIGQRFALVGTVFDLIKRFEKPLQSSMIFLAIAVGAYTGFLLSALKAFPIFNNPVLPILFLVSGASSGAAATMLFSMLCFKEPADSGDIHFVHKVEKPVLMTEVFLLVAFFLGLVFAGGVSGEAARVALMGDFWGYVFWGGVVMCGMILPWLLQWFSPKALTHRPEFVATLCILSLTGVFALRHFILYAGQMTAI
ncbi:cytochrome c nitrite reductase subunit NrfD [Ferrimonas marina]|uniref:Protein NrfD n=1 Tax=Ferrimonas marina TaxID=299255 RepID=A0A1M5X4I2_9GAMM|nr:cytochrome c nitrite reductase subunit NrfD [Ferrimonas marina]SHH94717.1 protein NrfD [Ferrimonas marina]